MMGITVVMPTIGRKSLRRSLNSVVYQMGREDEVIVVGDGPCSLPAGMIASYGPRVRYIELSEKATDWGGTPRNLGMHLARKEYISFMDDDDIYIPGAFKAMHHAIENNRGRAFLFKMKHMDKVIWEDPDIRMCNVSTQMLVMPNTDRNPIWAGHYEADLKFIMDVSALHPPHAPIMWMSDIIAKLDSHGKASG